MTPAGRLAEEAARWAWDAPAERIPTARDRLRQLAESTTDEQAQREISDASTMLSRLAGTMVHDSPSIIGQILEPHDSHGG